MSRHEFTTAPSRPMGEGETIGGVHAPATHDPLRFCVFTTVALLAWLFSAPAALLLTSGLGIVAYWRARRDGLLKSRCVLGDTRLVLLYLSALFVVAGTVLLRRVAGLL